MKKKKQIALNDSNDKKNNFNFESNEMKYLLFILFIGFLLRIFFYVELNATPFSNNLFSDSKIYNDYAISIVNSGNWIGSDVYFMAPVYPYFLAFIYIIFGKDSFNSVRLLQILIGTFTILFIYLATKNLFSKTTATVAAIFAAVYSNFIFYNNIILSETLQVFFITVFIYQISKLKETSRLKKWFQLGILFGIISLFRANILVFILVLLIWNLFRFFKNKAQREIIRKSFLIFLLGVFLVILPVTVRNYLVGDDLVLLTSNGGINFYIGNNKKLQPVFITPEEFNYASDMSGIKYAERILHKKLKPSEASSYWYKRGIDYIFTHPLKILLLDFKKFLLFWGESENPQSTIMDANFFKEHYSKILKLPFLLGFFFIAVFSIFGLYFTRRKDIRFILLRLLLISYIIGTIIFFVNGRFRMGIASLLIIFSAYGIEQIIKSVSSVKLKELNKPLIIVLSFTVIYYLFLDRPKFTQYDAYLQLGNIAFNKKDYKHAIENFQKSLFYRDYYKTYVNLGNALSLSKNYRNAIIAYRKAISRNKNYAKAYYNLGLTYVKMVDYKNAMLEFKKVIELNPNFAEAYQNIGVIYYIQEDYKHALEYLTKCFQLTNDSNLKRSLAKDINNIKLILKEKH